MGDKRNSNKNKSDINGKQKTICGTAWMTNGPLCKC